MIYSFVYFQYLYQNTNKFVAAIEWILSLNLPGKVDYEHCKILRMFLQALPFAFGTGDATQQNNLWKRRIQPRKSGPVRLGMGMLATLNDSGYAWVLDRIDWEKFTFREEIADEIIFGNTMLQTFYRTHGPKITESKNDLKRLETALRWLDRYGDVACCSKFIQDFILILIMRAYRRDVYQATKSVLIDPKKSARQLAPLIPINLESQFQPELDLLRLGEDSTIHMVTPFQTRFKKVEDSLAFIWGFNDDQRRDRWEDIPFRMLFKSTMEAFINKFNTKYALAFQEKVKRYFVATTWIFPYHTPTKFIQRNHYSEIIWTGYYHRRLAKGIRYAKNIQDTMQQINLPISKVWGTVLPEPTHYRAKKPGDSYMPDWKIVEGNPGKPNLMWKYSVTDLTSPLALFTDELPTIQQRLEKEWNDWHQIHDNVQD